LDIQIIPMSLATKSIQHDNFGHIYNTLKLICQMINIETHKNINIFDLINLLYFLSILTQDYYMKRMFEKIVKILFFLLHPKLFLIC